MTKTTKTTKTKTTKTTAKTKTISKTITRSAADQQVLAAAQQLLSGRPRETYVLIFQHGQVTGPDLNELCRQTTGQNFSLHTYLDDLCSSGWLTRGVMGISKTTGKPGTLWDISGDVGRSVFAPANPTTTRSTNMIVASMIGYTESRGDDGATYHEWWLWDSTGKDAKIALEYRVTASARWKELQATGVLIPTGTYRSQRDAVADTTARLHVTNKPAQVFKVREGATILDYKMGDKRTPKSSSLPSDQALILSAYQQLNKRWKIVKTAKGREQLLLKHMAQVAQALKMHEPTTNVSSNQEGVST